MNFVIYIVGKAFLNNLPSGKDAIAFTFNPLYARRFSKKSAFALIDTLVQCYEIDISDVVIAEIAFSYGKDSGSELTLELAS